MVPLAFVLACGSGEDEETGDEAGHCEPGKTASATMVARYDAGRVTWWHDFGEVGVDRMLQDPRGGIVITAGDDGAPLWFDATGAIVDGPALEVSNVPAVTTGDRLYHAGPGGLHARDANLAELWTFDPEGTPTWLATGPDDTSVIATRVGGTSGNVTRVDANGSAMWTAPWPVMAQGTRLDLRGVAILDDGTVAVMLQGPLDRDAVWIEAWSAEGTALWSSQIESARALGLFADSHGFVAFGGSQYDLVTWGYKSDGTPLWTTPLPYEDNQVIVCGDDGFIAGGTLFQLTDEGEPTQTYSVQYDPSGLVPGVDAPGASEGQAVATLSCTSDGGVLVVLTQERTDPGDCDTSG